MFAVVSSHLAAISGIMTSVLHKQHCTARTSQPDEQWIIALVLPRLRQAAREGVSS